MDGGSLGRYGLGSSHSSLDGVPFKIGQKFRPPPKVIYQPNIANSCSAPKEKYTFETEEAVLAWAKARDEALKKATIEQAKNSSSNSSETQNSSKGGQVANDQGKEDSTKNGLASCNSGQESNGDSSKGSGQTGIEPKPFIPTSMSEPNAILKPTPILRSNKDNGQSGSNSFGQSAVDVSMFEGVDDPFDTLELQTLDDMEELKVLLDSTSKDKTSGDEDDRKQSKDPSDSRLISEASESFYELAAPILSSCWENVDSVVDSSDTPDVNKFSKENAHLADAARSSESPASDIGDYVDITEEAISSPSANGTKHAHRLESSKLDLRNHTNRVLPKLNSDNGIYKPVLPPIPGNLSKMPNGMVETHTFEQNNSTPLPTSAANAVSSSYEDTPQSNSTVNKSQPVRLPPPPPTKPKRPAPTPKPRTSVQTGPSIGSSLTDSFEGNLKSADEPALNPFSLHSMNISNTDTSEDRQLRNTSPVGESSSSTAPQLNRWRPLPPPPKSPADQKNQPLGLTDPYTSLSHEAQEFTDRITSMGFLRAKVARAVEKFGQDEKEVLDHLFAVDLLVERKYAPIHAEAALHSCKNDLDKAERLLKLQSQLEQFGFKSENVRDALIKSDMDHDKALDLLTA